MWSQFFILIDRSIEELVTSDDLARFIDKFVDKQDLKNLGFVTPGRRRNNSNSYRYRYKNKSCGNCPFKAKCASGKTGRTISRLVHESALERSKKKQELEDNRVKFRKCKTIVERIFSYIKEIPGFRRWTVRGLEEVKNRMVTCLYSIQSGYTS